MQFILLFRALTLCILCPCFLNFARTFSHLVLSKVTQLHYILSSFYIRCCILLYSSFFFFLRAHLSMLSWLFICQIFELQSSYPVLLSFSYTIQKSVPVPICFSIYFSPFVLMPPLLCLSLSLFHFQFFGLTVILKRLLFLFFLFHIFLLFHYFLHHPLLRLPLSNSLFFFIFNFYILFLLNTRTPSLFYFFTNNILTHSLRLYLWIFLFPPFFLSIPLNMLSFS